MAEAPPWIAVVDDDPAVLKALSRLLRSHAFHAQTYGSAQEFLAALPAGLPVCLIVDLQMPEMNGLELQQHLISSGTKIPTILITAHAEAALQEASDEGTLVASLRKPLQEEALFSAIKKAIGSSRNAELKPGAPPLYEKDI
ncbi:FixJ family two-component response regulator [Bradyrhizobium sp. AZCC 1610]